MASPSDLVRRLLDNWPAKIIALGLALVVVLFNDLADVGERYFTVPLELRLDERVVPGDEYENRVRVNIRGDEARIFDVLEEDVIAYADFTEHTTAGVYREPIQIRRTGTALELDALEVSVEPVNVTVTLETKLVRSLEVVPNIAGFPPPGYELSDYRVSPTTVNVVGPESLVADLTQILTEEISLTGRTADFAERVRLSRPDPLVDFPGGTIVDFRALIVETVVQVTFEDLDVVVVDLPGDLAVVSDLPSGSMRVQGKQLDVEDAAPDRIGLFVDASEIDGPGTYALQVRPLIPAGVLVLGIEPARVEVTIVDATEEVTPPGGEELGSAETGLQDLPEETLNERGEP